MKFGEYLQSAMKKEWSQPGKNRYVEYELLKEMIDALSATRADKNISEAALGKSAPKENRITSLTMNTWDQHGGQVTMFRGNE